jgi:hypothetical protein
MLLTQPILYITTGLNTMEENMLVNNSGKGRKLLAITARSQRTKQHQRSKYNEYNYSVLKTYPAGNNLFILLIFIFSVSPLKQNLKTD